MDNGNQGLSINMPGTFKYKSVLVQKNDSNSNIDLSEPMKDSMEKLKNNAIASHYYLALTFFPG